MESSFKVEMPRGDPKNFLGGNTGKFWTDIKEHIHKRAQKTFDGVCVCRFNFRSRTQKNVTIFSRNLPGELTAYPADIFTEFDRVSISLHTVTQQMFNLRKVF